jgi:hypothetical protein
MPLVSILGISLSEFKEVPMGGSYAERGENGVMSDYRKARDGSLYRIFPTKIYRSEDDSIQIFRRCPMNFNSARDGFSPPPENPKDLGDLIVQYDAGRTGLFSIGYTRYVSLCPKGSDSWNQVVETIMSAGSGFYSQKS